MSLLKKTPPLVFFFLLFFRDIASAAESGWDFSSRWLADGCSLHTIRTTRIIPADLNALLYRMERHIASFAAALGAHFTVRRFEAAADQRRTALNSLMWDDALGGWSDLLLSDQPIVCPASPHTLSASVVAAVVMPQPPQPLHSSDGQERSGSGVGDSGGARPQPGSFSGGGSSGCPALNVSPPASPVVGVSRLIGRGTYASSWVPLHCGVAGDDKQAAAAVDGLKRSGLLHTVGVATSDVESGQQWDAPNVWPPLQQMIIAGCRLYGGEAGAALAADLTRSWLEAGLMGFKSTGAMHEKYNASKSDGAAGSGGEYAPQVGFGWTNGVALELLAETVAVARSTINMRGDAGGASAAAFAAAR